MRNRSLRARAPSFDHTMRILDKHNHSQFREYREVDARFRELRHRNKGRLPERRIAWPLGNLLPCTPSTDPFPGLHFFGGMSLYSGMHGLTVSAKYKHHGLAVLATEANGRWAVEAAVSWTEGIVGRIMQCGPYDGFVSQVDAQSWGIISCINWIDSGKSEPSPFIPVSAQLGQESPVARVVNRRFELATSFWPRHSFRSG